MIKIDGDDYFYFPEHVARRLAKTAVENAALKSENEVLKKSNKTLVANHIFNVEMAEYYRKMSETNFEYMVKRLEHTQKPDPFYKRFSFGFISGFGLAAASYFFWDYARDN
ncbi:MAG: hypothetical protein CL489_10930 [Acidobacteria bacterium]|nr:hypothetical protein [Acidobacteriota bacterium]